MIRKGYKALMRENKKTLCNEILDLYANNTALANHAANLMSGTLLQAIAALREQRKQYAAMMKRKENHNW